MESVQHGPALHGPTSLSDR